MKAAEGKDLQGIDEQKTGRDNADLVILLGLPVLSWECQ